MYVFLLNVQVFVYRNDLKRDNLTIQMYKNARYHNNQNSIFCVFSTK